MLPAQAWTVARRPASELRFTYGCSTGGQRGIECDFFGVDAENQIDLIAGDGAGTRIQMHAGTAYAVDRSTVIGGNRVSGLVEIHVQLRSGTEHIRAAREEPKTPFAGNEGRTRTAAHVATAAAAGREHEQGKAKYGADGDFASVHKISSTI